MKQQLHTPEGVRDIYNEECTKKIIIQDKLHKAFKSYGYHDIETPTIEFFDVFSKEVGTISIKELYKFFDREGNTLVLRPDITPSIGRAAAKLYTKEDLPVRLCYIGKTFINHSSYQGRLKETTQLGAELIGDDSVMVDAELLALVIESLLSVGLTEFQVSIGQVNFYKSLIKEAGIDEETEEKLKTFITNKNHFGVEELLSRESISSELKHIFLRMPELFGTADILEEAMALTKNTEALAAVKRLLDVYEVLKQYGLESYVSFDLGMIGNYMYYTGVIFRAYTYGTGDAVVKGGRYDKLLSVFGMDAASIGFAIILDELVNALERQKIEIPYPKENTLILYEAKQQHIALKLTKQFRSNGMNVELMEFQEGKTLQEYKTFGNRHHLGGILYLEDETNVQIVNLERDTVQLTDIASLLK